MKNKKALMEDALHATRAAVEEGILPGGGVAVLRASEVLDGVEVDGEDEKQGLEVLRKALREPLKHIAANAGENGSVIVRKVERGSGAYGFDARKMEFTDMFEAGVVDPTRVVRSALENAASVATLLLTTDCLVTEIPKKDDEQKMPQPGMGGMPQF